MVLTLFGVVGGASLGALLRFWVFNLINPLWGLLVVNSLGSLIAGLVARKISMGVWPAGSLWLGTAFLLVGFCGSLTTFSSYVLELVYLLERGYFFKTACHFFLNNALCLLMCYIGYSKLSWI